MKYYRAYRVLDDYPAQDLVPIFVGRLEVNLDFYHVHSDRILGRMKVDGRLANVAKRPGDHSPSCGG